MLDVIVLAGGAARRLGGAAKGEVPVAGRALLDHVLAAAHGARDVVVVGPEELARTGVPTVLEDPPRGGPVAGIEAGLRHLVERRPDHAPGGLVAVLACDVPRAPAALPHLRAALAARPGADGSHLTDEGRSQLVMLVHAPALARALGRLATDGGTRGRSVRRLVAELDLVDVPDTWGYGHDADTWEDVGVLDALLEEENHERT